MRKKILFDLDKLDEKMGLNVKEGETETIELGGEKLKISKEVISHDLGPYTLVLYADCSLLVFDNSGIKDMIDLADMREFMYDLIASNTKIVLPE
jgi:hypothetical protein